MNGHPIGRVTKVQRIQQNVFVATEIDRSLCLDPQTLTANSFPEGLIGEPVLQLWQQGTPSGQCVSTKDTLSFVRAAGPLRFMPSLVALLDSIGSNWNFAMTMVDSLSFVKSDFQEIQVQLKALQHDWSRMKSQVKRAQILVVSSTKTVNDASVLAQETQAGLRKIPWQAFEERIDVVLNRIQLSRSRLRATPLSGAQEAQRILAEKELEKVKEQLQNLSNHLKQGKLEMNVDVW